MTPAHRETPGVLPANRTDFISLPIGQEPECPEFVAHQHRVLIDECRIITTMLVSDTVLIAILVWFGAWVSTAIAFLLWCSVACWLWAKTRELKLLEVRYGL